jgi:hypothetical protein
MIPHIILGQGCYARKITLRPRPSSRRLGEAWHIVRPLISMLMLLFLLLQVTRAINLLLWQ